MKFLLTLLLISINAKALSKKNFWPEGVSLLKDIRDLKFNIRSSSFNEILSLKDEVQATMYWIPTKKELVLKGSYEMKKAELLKQAFNSKISILINESFNAYIKNYKYIGLVKSWHRFEDPIGAEDNSEIWIKKGKLKVDIIEKKPIGTQYISYEFKKMNKMIVIDKVTHKSFIGLQSYLSISTIEYIKAHGHTLPSKVLTETTQKLTTNDSNTPERTLVEEIKFDQYSVNNSKALGWFSKR